MTDCGRRSCRGGWNARPAAPKTVSGTLRGCLLFTCLRFQRMRRSRCSLWNCEEPEGSRPLHFYLQRYDEGAMKLEIEVNIGDDTADNAGLQEHLRKEGIPALFAERRIPVDKAAHELGRERIASWNCRCSAAFLTSSTLRTIGTPTPRQLTISRDGARPDSPGPSPTSGRLCT